MTKKSDIILIQWIRETRGGFRAFLDKTDFPDPIRFSKQGPTFTYP
jgi:hypothetical protein